jgi:hypothetical protein
MPNAHYFLIDDLATFLLDLEARHYQLNRSHPDDHTWVVYSKMKSGALIKHYSYSRERIPTSPMPIRVTYELIRGGIPLKQLTRKLKVLNANYRKSLPGWKTKRESRRGVRKRRWHQIQKFLKQHAALIASFKYQSDDRLTEGNLSYNLHIASTTKEQAICIEFIKALVDACAPGTIVRRYRQTDKPMLQRNGWIKRFAGIHRKRGWSVWEVVQEAQKELREGTWNQRMRRQYNLSNSTISKIAGLKLAPMSQN